MKQRKNKKPATGFHTHPDRINRKGRPKSAWTWRGLLMEMAEKAAEDGRPVKVHLAEALLKKGLAQDVSALKEFGDRIDGKAVQRDELTGTDGGEIKASLTLRFK